MTLRAGLTGGIACGKSRVLRRLAAAGFETLDLDRVAHDVMAPGGSAYREVAEAFGPGILAADGTVDRQRLGDLVFTDPAARARLDAIVHPRVREEEARRVSRPGREGRVFVTDAALLVEAGVHLRFDRLVVVHCEPDQQLARLMGRDGVGEGAARARIAAQMPAGEKRRFAHFVVDATGTPDETDRAADALAQELARLARAPRPRRGLPRARLAGAFAEGPVTGPRGLDPRRVLTDIAAGGPEMGRLARLLSPPATGPWYRAALAAPPGAGPETLAAPLVAWALARGHDDEWLAGAAFSLARLTHVEPPEVSAGVVFALALAAAAAEEALADMPGRLPAWGALGERWAGAAPPPRIAAAIEAAARDDGARGEPSGALSGAARGMAPEALPPEVARALEDLERRVEA